MIALVVLAVAAGIYYAYYRPPTAVTLTGIVTTHDVVVSPQVGGQLRALSVTEGDVVKRDQVIGLISQDELMADTAYSAHTADAIGSQIREGESALRLQEMQTAEQVRQAESTLVSAESQAAAAAANLDGASVTKPVARTQAITAQGGIADVADRGRKSTVLIEGGTAAGSGIIVDQSGRIVTNYHVVEGQKTLKVVLVDGTASLVCSALCAAPQMFLDRAASSSAVSARVVDDVVEGAIAFAHRASCRCFS